MTVEKFISDTRAQCKKHGVKLHLPNTELVEFDGDKAKSAGYFDSESKVLAVAKKMPLDSYLGLIAHESSHMDQWMQDPYLWEKCSYGYTLFFEWLDGKIVKREHLEEAVQDIIRLEKDCELRAIAKIIKYNLPINLDKYSRKANAYLYSFLFVLETKKWIPKIYEPEYVWKVAPSRFKKQYLSLPVRLRAAFKRSKDGHKNKN